MLLLTVALGLTAAAHLLAAMIGFVMALVLMLYLAERRRSYVMQILVFSAVGALAILFAFYAFRPAPFSYVFTGGGARFWFSLDECPSLLPEHGERADCGGDAGGAAALCRRCDAAATSAIRRRW